ncbi:hypothetical protein T01_12620 [Trichinella spiralis]|uniref:Uncharacterized protein n=1 Tax=Trichinella spiralis TaxID=6334 RepID=A0A0V1BV50_TRISP|nr:hypothetical protein T01_12620 [Trichinella spiralis]
MTEAARRKLFPPGSTRDNSSVELKRLRPDPSEISHKKWMKWDAVPGNQRTNWLAVLSSACFQGTPLRAPYAGTGDSRKGTPAGGKCDRDRGRPAENS